MVFKTADYHTRQINNNKHHNLFVLKSQKKKTEMRCLTFNSRNNFKCFIRILQKRNSSMQTPEKKEGTHNLFGAQYCMSLVEKNDYENYLCTLLLKGEQRRHAFSLRAFNVEVAKCAGNVTEPHIAKIRLKFWHDSIDKCYKNEKSYVADHPVLSELQNTLQTHKLNKVYLRRMVTARDRTPNQQFITLKELEDYADQTYASLLHLLIEIKGIKDINVDHAVSHLGKAQGIATLLRAIPYLKRSQALHIPQEILIGNGVSQERVLRQQTGDKGVEDCIFEVATSAYQHLEMARKLHDKVPKEVRKLLLTAIPVDRYLERLRRANFRLTDQSCMQRDAMLPIALYWHNLRGTY